MDALLAELQAVLVEIRARVAAGATLTVDPHPLREAAARIEWAIEILETLD